MWSEPENPFGSEHADGVALIGPPLMRVGAWQMPLACTAVLQRRRAQRAGAQQHEVGRTEILAVTLVRNQWILMCSPTLDRLTNSGGRDACT